MLIATINYLMAGHFWMPVLLQPSKNIETESYGLSEWVYMISAQIEIQLWFISSITEPIAMGAGGGTPHPQISSCNIK